MANSGHKPLDVATTDSVSSSNGGSNMPLSEPSSRGSAMTDTTPTLVAPVPRYASAQAQELSLYNSAQTNASSALPDDKVGDDRTAAFLAVLPRQGATQDAQAAVDKLERMRRAKEHKRRWLNGTGIAGLAHLATAKAKEKTPKQRRRKDKNGDDDDISDADSTASSLNLYGEVRLAISSMPGFNVLSTKASAARRERAESPPPHGEDEGRSSAFRFGSTRRRSSLVPPSPSLQQRQHSLATNAPLVQAQTDAVRDAPSLSADSAPAPTVAKQITPACDLDTLKEERRIEEATDILTRPGTATKSAIKPKAERPRLMLQSPSEDINIPDGDMMQSPEDMQLAEGRFNDTRAPSSDGASPRFNGYAMPPSPQGQSDVDAYAAAEQCRKALSRRSMMDESAVCDPQMAESIGAESSGAGGSDGSESDSEDSTDMDESYEQQQAMFVSLQHGNEMSPKEKKKLLRRIRRRSKRQSEGEGGTVGRSQAGDVSTSATAPVNGRRQQPPKLSLSNHISTGLHYATSQSRNRRAIERYSPHPSRPGSAKPFQSGTLGGMTAPSASPPIGTTIGNISRSSTPGNALQSERSSLSNEEGRDAVAPINSRPSSIAMADGDDDLSRMDELKGQLLRRWGTNQSMVSNAASTGKGASLKNRIMSLRRNRNQPSDVAEEGDDDATPRREQDAAEHELDTALQRLAAQEAPEEVGEQYAYDVLYENQRGMLFFGIPKFSAKTLFQWDPAAWTNGRNGNSAYNVVNAQLPDPSWEWVHEEWMIDMSGNVDESGWQYSYNFRTVQLPLLKRPAQAVPRGGRDGNRQMNERFDKEMDGLSKREAKTAHREDDGLEALKRSAIARQAKWTGIPTQNTYVRRRRWIRLRRRKPMEVSTASANTPKAEVPFGMSKGSMDWAQLIKEGKARENKTQSQLDVNDEAALSDVEEGTATNTSSSSSSSDELEEGPADGHGESDFLARRVYGHLRSGADPLAERTSKEHSRRRRHAREFTGTIRELKSLLPSILNRRGGRAHRSTTASRQKALWLAEIDARNPFISWSYVKRRLEDDDLAFATTTLRARERRHAKRASERRERAGSRGGSRDGHDGSATPPPPPLSEHFELTKDALVEINFRRVLRVIKACKLDRQKVQLWRLWLNVDQLNASNTETSRNEDLIELGLAASAAAASEHLLRDKAELMRLARTRWRNAYTPTDVMDVWDVVERRLDRLLLTFEFQSSRAAFLRLLLTIHAASHAVHRFRPAQPMRVGTSTSPRSPTAEEVGVPASLSMTPAGDEWRAARVPRLEFWSDLIDCARSVVATTATGQGGSPSMLLHEQSSSVSPRVNGAESTPITVPGLSFAMRPLSRSTTPVDGSAPPTSSIRHVRKGSSSVGSERQSSPRVRSAHFPSGSITEWNNFGGGSTTAAARLQSGSPSPSTSALLHDADSAFLARLLQVPVQRQKDIILQSCGSVFETKANAQTHVEQAADDKAAAAAHEREDSEVVRRLSAALDRDM